MRVTWSKKKLYSMVLLLAFSLLIYNKIKRCLKYTKRGTELNDLILTKLNKKENKREFKYILQWTSPTNFPFAYMGEGRKGFINRMCPFTNCVVTANRTYLDGDYTKFDVIVFDAPEVVTSDDLPKKRSPHQKYVFASIESADNYPVCSNRFDKYFNWTWTYRLTSEVRWGYMLVKDNKNNVVGPNVQMNWVKLEDMDPISDEFKKQLKSKTKAAAWFVSKCYTKSRREKYAAGLKNELRKYRLDLDVYGACGNLECSEDDESKCNNIIKDTYYFYLAFENSLSEDYVTEKLLRALQNDVVPIVYGGANYSRFMPDGIYLNARELEVAALAKKMHELINNPDKYAKYFKWKKYYSYQGRFYSVETMSYCLFCAHLNNENMVNKITVYKNFREWWDPPNRC